MKRNFTFYLEPQHLDELANKYRHFYALAEPFPHTVIDNFLPEPLLEQVLQEFPQPNKINWQTFNTPTEKKIACAAELQMGEFTRFVLHQLNSSIFINFLEKLTGIEGLIPDPHFVGAGLHQIERGGFLKIHADFNRHEKLKLDRRLNLLLYLNKNWQEGYGGHLELWRSDMSYCEKKILPIFNRCVIFSTTDYSYHGHPEPLNCPKAMTRKSLALYYYSNGRPAAELSTAHSTLFRERSQENFASETKNISATKIIKKFIPPILIDAKNYLINHSK